MKLFASCLTLSAALLAQPLLAQSPEQIEEARENVRKELIKVAEHQRETASAAPARPGLPEPIPFTQEYEPNPAIWKLSDEDTTIYMFGTYHVLPKGFRWRSDAFNAIVNEVDELVVETSDDDVALEDDKFMEQLMTESMGEARVTISSRLSEGNREKWLSIADEIGMPRGIFDRMPLLLSMLGAGIALSEQQGSRDEYGVETILEAEFKAAGKPIGSIERSDKVMRALLNIDEDEMLRQLDEDLTNWTGDNVDAIFSGGEQAPTKTPDKSRGPIEEDVFSVEHSWAQGELDEMDETTFGNNVTGKAIYTILLVDRNRAWAEWLDNRLDQPGNILLAVGAGHFEGADSVQVMLAKRGLTVERLH